MPTIAVLSMKGGVGKTTIALGLASAAWYRHWRTLIVDLDPQANASMGVGLMDPALTVGDALADGRPGVAAGPSCRAPGGEAPTSYRPSQPSSTESPKHTDRTRLRTVLGDRAPLRTRCDRLPHPWVR